MSDSKRCSKCRETKPRAAFTQEHYACKTCESAAARLRREKNPELSRNAVARYRKRHPEAVKASQDRFRLNNPDYEAKRRASYTHVELAAAMADAAERVQRYREQHPERIRDISLNAGAKKRMMMGATFETLSRSRIYRRDRGLCYLRYPGRCLGHVSYDDATIDHVVPLCKGGSHTYDNVAVACWPCNARKQASSPEPFLSPADPYIAKAAANLRRRRGGADV